MSQLSDFRPSQRARACQECPLDPNSDSGAAANAAASVERRTIRHLNTEFAGFLHKVALFGPLSELMLRESDRGTKHDL